MAGADGGADRGGGGPLRNPGRLGDTWGEKGDWAGLLCSPWLLVEPEALTAELMATSVPVGRSSMEPDRSWEERERDREGGREVRRHGGQRPQRKQGPSQMNTSHFARSKHGHVPLPTGS